MKPTFLQKLSHWFGGLVQGCIQGGAVSVKAFAGSASAHVLVPNIVPALDWRSALAIFGTSAFWHGWDYLSKNPIPLIEQELTERTEDLPGQGNLPGQGKELQGAEVKTLVTN